MRRISLPWTGAEAEEGAEAGVGGVGGEAACGGELGVGSVDACGNGGEGEVPVPAGGAVEDAGEPELSAQAQDGGDMAVGEGAADGDGGFEIGEGDAAADDGADAVDERGGQFGEVGDGAPSDALALAPGLPEEDGGGALAVGDGVDVEGQGGCSALHGNIIVQVMLEHKRAPAIRRYSYMATNIPMSRLVRREQAAPSQ